MALKPDKPDREATPTALIVPYLVVVILLSLFYFLFYQKSPADPRYDIPYSQFKSYLEQERIASVVLSGDLAKGEFFDPEPIGPQGQSTTLFSTRIPAFGDESLLPALEQRGVEVKVQKPAGEASGISYVLAMLPWLVFFIIFFWIIRRAGKRMGGGIGGGTDLKRFLEPPQKQAEIPDVTFADVAGQINAKREVTELADYLRAPQKFLALGAEIPRGVLLMGPPGTGKTLLARALAGEAGVPFYSISASEFIEVFVGVGASRVRHLFQDAKQNAPSIVFIDELDSVGRTRGTGLGGGHDEREQTLNQILAEMDGFSGHEAVIVLAATNRPDVLDSALLRPGRFDRHVILDLPDRNDRIAILKVHSKKVPLAEDVQLDKLAAGTPGFSGADLKNLVNEAAILAAREDDNKVRMKYFDAARDKVIMGTERSLAIEPEERHRLAVHEAGHALVAYYLPNADTLYKVSIVPRGRSLGATQQLPEHERHTLPENYLKDRLAVILAGRAAEKELIGTISSGADDDIHQATHLARAMVSRWGMAEEIGPVDLRESEEHPFLGREIAQPRHYSEHSAEAVDDAVKRLLLDAEHHAADTISTHRSKLEMLVEMLEKRETLYKQQIEMCLGTVESDPMQGANEAKSAE